MGLNGWSSHFQPFKALFQNQLLMTTFIPSKASFSVVSNKNFVFGTSKVNLDF
jgi:hypothetical protein